MNNTNKFTRNITAFVLCGALASVCWADAATVPDTPKEKPAAQQEASQKITDASVKQDAVIEKKTAEQPQAVPDETNNEVITDHVDQKTGKKYQELKAEFIVKSFKYYKPTSNTGIIIINNYAVKKHTARLSDDGYFSAPEPVDREKSDQFSGMKAQIFCRLRSIGSLPGSCMRSCSAVIKSTDKFCSLYGNDKYFVVIE